MPKISVGRDEEDREEHGLEGTGIIGKHLVGENEEAHKANPIYFDLARPHVMGIFGKRGTGKSYSMGTIAEELQGADISQNLSTIIIDPMGIYWSMKRPNERAAGLLERWDITPDAFEAQVYIPQGKVRDFEEREMPYDDTFTLNAGELSAADWSMAFDLGKDSQARILLERIVTELSDRNGEDYTVDDMIQLVKEFDFPEETKNRLENRFMNAQDWGVFGEKSSLDKLTQRGEL
ncbi:MAG: helicase HerA domain-containing protein, partial [Candidatus Nanohaloarchaea archaeon]